MDLLMLMSAKCKKKQQVPPSTPTTEAPPVLDKQPDAYQNGTNGHDGVNMERDNLPKAATRPTPLQLQEVKESNSHEMSTGHSTPEQTGLPEPGGMSDVGRAPTYNKDQTPPPPYSSGSSESHLNTPRQIFLKL